MDAVIQSFYQHADAEQAVQMAAYMKDQFPFLGIRTPLRRRLSQAFFKAAAASGRIDWSFVERCWALPEREFQYLAADYLRALQAFLREEDLPRLKQLVISKSWWDTVDNLDRTIGNINFPSRQIDAAMLDWSASDNIWLRRVAIDHQLLRKEKTNTGLLEKILVNNLGQQEFFINKAMGWALRDFSKTNPDWVRHFLERHRSGLSALTIREAGKYL